MNAIEIKMVYKNEMYENLIDNRNKMTAIDEIELLRGLPINMDSQTIEEVIKFRQENIGDEITMCGVLAAAAIVSQLKQLPSVDKTVHSRIGITIESIMRCISPRLSPRSLQLQIQKEAFLETVERQSRKYRLIPTWLLLKIDEISMGYRIYNKFRMVFAILAQGVPPSIQPLLAATLWIAYLFIKNTAQQANTIFCTKVLSVIFLTFFDSPDTNQVFLTAFPESIAASAPGTPTFKYTAQKEIQIQLLQLLKSIHSLRYKFGNIISLLKNDFNYSLRFLDDISNEYETFKLPLLVQRQYVDEISFLQLQKDIPPVPYSRQQDSSSDTKMLSFDSDEDEKIQKSNEINFDDRSQAAIQQFNNRSTSNVSCISCTVLDDLNDKTINDKGYCTSQSTPLHMRQQNVTWVYACINKNTFNEEQTEKHKNQVYAAITKFSPPCNDIFKKVQLAHSFYCSLFGQCKNNLVQSASLNNDQNAMSDIVQNSIQNQVANVVCNANQKNVVQQKDHNNIKNPLQDIPFIEMEDSIEILPQNAPQIPTNNAMQIESPYSFFMQANDVNNKFVSGLTNGMQEEKYKSTLMCLSTYIFNFSHQPVPVEYKKYCQIFQTTLADGYYAIIRALSDIKFPKNISKQLQSLKKKIVVQELWSDNYGYDLLKKASGLWQDFILNPQFKAQTKQVSDLSQIELLFLHSIFTQAIVRVQQLCSTLFIELVQETRIKRLFSRVLQTRCHLFSASTLDKIILCTIACSLSINHSSNLKQLQKVFEQYNDKLTHTFYYPKHELETFYKQVFIKEVDDLLADSEVNLPNTPTKMKRRVYHKNSFMLQQPQTLTHQQKLLKRILKDKSKQM